MDARINIANCHICEEMCEKMIQCLKELGFNEDAEDMKTMWSLQKKLLDNQQNDEEKKILMDKILSRMDDQEFVEGIQ
jgi:tRNA C32,U32 (ribose-2'-O)-methylase TrmJ